MNPPDVVVKKKRKQIPKELRRIPHHLHKKRGPKPKPHVCRCTRPGIKPQGKDWLCAWCAAIEGSQVKRRKTSGMNRRIRADMGGLEVYSYSNAPVEY